MTLCEGLAKETCRNGSHISVEVSHFFNMREASCIETITTSKTIHKVCVVTFEK